MNIFFGHAHLPHINMSAGSTKKRILLGAPLLMVLCLVFVVSGVIGCGSNPNDATLTKGAEDTGGGAAAAGDGESRLNIRMSLPDGTDAYSDGDVWVEDLAFGIELMEKEPPPGGPFETVYLAGRQIAGGYDPRIWAWSSVAPEGKRLRELVDLTIAAGFGEDVEMTLRFVSSMSAYPAVVLRFDAPDWAALEQSYFIRGTRLYTVQCASSEESIYGGTRADTDAEDEFDKCRKIIRGLVFY